MSVDRQTVSKVDVSVFFAELAMLAGLAVAGWRLGIDGPMAVAVAVAFPLVAAVIWGLWLAPRATRRLRYPDGLIVKLTLVIIAAGLLARSGAVVWAVAIFLVVGSLFSLGEMSHRPDRKAVERRQVRDHTRRARSTHAPQGTSAVDDPCSAVHRSEGNGEVDPGR